MRIKSVLRETGLFGLIGLPIWIFGHDFGYGRRCIRCHEPKRLGGKNGRN